MRQVNPRAGGGPGRGGGSGVAAARGPTETGLPAGPAARHDRRHDDPSDVRCPSSRRRGAAAAPSDVRGGHPTAMNSALVAGLLAGWGIAIPVGAVAAYLVGLTARSGPRVGAAAALGVASADGVYALIAVLGGVALTGVISAIATPLHWVSVVVLVFLGGRIIWSAVSDHRTRSELAGPESVTRPGRAYVTLLGI